MTNWNALKERNNECVDEITDSLNEISKCLDDMYNNLQEQLDLIKESTEKET